MTTTPAHVDIPALAKRLTKAQRRVLAEVPAGNVRQYTTYPYTTYVSDWYPGGAVTATARRLVGHGLVERQRKPGGRYVYELTDLGQAVLDHLGERAS